MRLSLSRTVTFRAWHRLFEQALSAEENRRKYGPVAESHPHDYRCRVTVERRVADHEAMVIDLALLDRLLDEEILGRFAEKHIHRDDAAFAIVLPTCEALARDLFRRLALRLPAGVALSSVVVAEDDTLSAECRGDE